MTSARPPFRLPRWILALLLGAGAFLALATASPAPSAVPEAPLLFETLPQPPLAKSAAGGPALPRFTLRRGPLVLRRDPATLAALPALTLDLFGRRVAAVKVRTVRHAADHVEWVGAVPGDPGASVVLVLHRGVLVGRVETRDGYHEIRGEAGGGASLHAVDLAALKSAHAGHPRDCGRRRPGPLAKPGAEAPRSAAGAAGAASADGDGSPAPAARAAAVTLDLMVLYDQAVLAKRPDVVAFTQSLVAQANDAFARSRVDAALRLVHVARLEKGFLRSDSASLERLTRDMEVEALRARHGADLVTVLTAEPQASGSSGIADIDGAHALTAIEWAQSLRTFSHEIGHNLGALHNREDAYNPSFSPPAGTFNYGYRDFDRRFLTIMAYRGDCHECVFLNNFSNPDVLHDGAPTGVAGWIDNARKLRETVGRVAGWMSDSHALRVELEGSGRVRSDLPGIDCGADCREAYPKPAIRKVTLTAAPDPGWLFQAWEGACSGSGPCAVTVDGDRQVTARFTPDPGNLTVHLHDVRANRDLATLEDFSALRLDTLPEEMTVVARLKSAAGSVKFELAGTQFRAFVAPAPPYALFGSLSGRPLAWPALPSGRLNLTITAHAGADGTGAVIARKTVVLDFQAPPVSAPAPLPAPLAVVRPGAGGLELSLARPARLTVSLRSPAGRARLLASGDFTAGTRSLPWGGPGGPPSGMHLLHVEGVEGVLHRAVVRIP